MSLNAFSVERAAIRTAAVEETPLSPSAMTADHESTDPVEPLEQLCAPTSSPPGSG
jgi:hypothetical protein